MLLSTPLRAFYLTFLFLSWLLCSVVAAPVGHGHSASASATSGLQPSAVKFINWLHSNAATINAKPICFYSGHNTTGGKTTKTWKAIKSFSSQMGCNYMQTLLKMTDDSVLRSDSNKWQDAEWSAVSEAVAAVAENTPVYALLGDTVERSSVWIRREKPMLQQRLRAGKIQSVVVYSWSASGSKYAFTRVGNLSP